MIKAIATTTIYPPGEVLQKYDEMEGWTLIVTGDLNTPADFRLENGIYLSPSDQEKMAPGLSDSIGWNSIQRRNLAFLKAYQLGAEVIATIDDDNIPEDDWGTDLLLGCEVEVDEFQLDTPLFDPVGATNYPHLWHRGFPLQEISSRDYSRKIRTTIRPDIQAAFWNGDPDVDAVCRMEHRPECDFCADVFPFSANRPGPFNSQNTFISREVLPHYFMFPYVGRADDVWASYYVQSLGFKVVYSAPSVYQARNPQDLTTNLVDEFFGYRNTLEFTRSLFSESGDWRQFLPEKSRVAFDQYRRCFQAPGA